MISALLACGGVARRGFFQLRDSVKNAHSYIIIQIRIPKALDFSTECTNSTVLPVTSIF